MTNIQRNGRVALITGASRGIGAATARVLASRGMRVVVNYRSSIAEADDVVASIKSAGGQAMAVQADVRDDHAVLGMVEQVRGAMGEVEVLVHNALIPYAIKSFDEISWDELGGKLEQEMRAAFLMTKAVVPDMTARGYGRIVYLGTVLARVPREGMIALGHLEGGPEPVRPLRRAGDGTSWDHRQRGVPGTGRRNRHHRRRPRPRG